MVVKAEPFSTQAILTEN